MTIQRLKAEIARWIFGCYISACPECGTLKKTLMDCAACVATDQSTLALKGHQLIENGVNPPHFHPPVEPSWRGKP